MLNFYALRQNAKCWHILEVSKVTCLGFVPKARETAKAIANTPQSLYYSSAAELEQIEL